MDMCWWFGLLHKLGSIVPLILTTSATAASLLIAAFVFLYTTLREIQSQYRNDYSLYVKEVHKVYGELEAKLSGGKSKRTSSSASDRRDEFDYEWRSDKYFEVPPELSDPDTLRKDLLSFVELRQLGTNIIFGESIGISPDQVDFTKAESVDKIVNDMRNRNLQSWIEFNWVSDLSNRRVHFQSIFVTQLPERTLRVSHALQTICTAILLFVGSIALSMLGFYWSFASVLSLFTYWTGWIFIVLLVRLAWSLIPKVRRFKSMKPFELGTKV